MKRMNFGPVLTRRTDSEVNGGNKAVNNSVKMCSQKGEMTMTSKIMILCIVGILVIGVFYFFLGQENEEFQLVPRDISRKVATAAEAKISGTEVGTGWSTSEYPETAVREAVDMALGDNRQRNPDLAVIYASAGSDMMGILNAAKRILGESTKIFGGTSDSRAVMTDKGFVRVSQRGYAEGAIEGSKGLAIMTVTSKDITCGVGSAGLSEFASVQEMSAAAVLSAIKSAGKTEGQKPAVVLLTSTIGIEEEVIEGVEQVVGRDTLLLGGTVGGPDIAVFGEDAIHKKGVCLAVIYTDLPLGWTFEGGFDVTDKHSGIVTKVDGQDIVEIDNKPALDVYDQWLGGEIEELHNQARKPDAVRDLLTLHPLYRRYASDKGQNYFLFSHPWPKDDKMQDRCISTSTKIKPGERIYLSHGTWETLVNRIGNLPRNAKIYGGTDAAAKPLFGLGFICGGVLGAIPESEREKLAILINYSNSSAPFIACFTWGEQGHFPGVGNKHGNLLTSFLVVGSRNTR